MDRRAPLVSIVLPTYNRASMLSHAVSSCLSQTLKEFELIIVDDGSTDETSKIALQFAAQDPRVRYLHKENAGLPAALNFGFAQARGSFWTWTSDDNAYRSTAIAAMVDALQKHEEYGLVYTGFNWVDSEGKITRVVSDRRPERLPVENVVGPCFLYRRSVAEVIGGYSIDLALVEDWDYWLRLSTAAKVMSLDEVHYDYLDHPANLSHQRKIAVYEAVYRMRQTTPCRDAGKHVLLGQSARQLSCLYAGSGFHKAAFYWKFKALVHRAFEMFRIRSIMRP